MAGGFRFSTLHSRATLRSATFRFIPIIVSLQPRLPTQECLLHSIALRPTRRLIPLPFGFTTHNPELKAKTGSSIQPNPIRYITFSHHPCFSPCQPAVCPAKCSPLKTKDLKTPRHPLNVQVKKEHSRKAIVLAAGSSLSFNRSPGHSFLATPLTYSFRSPLQLQHHTCKCFVPQHPHLSPPTIRSFPHIFTCELFAP